MTSEPTYYSGPPIVRPAQYVTVGYREEYVIIFAAPKYPEVYSDRAVAEERARRCGRTVTVRMVSIRKRVTP